MSKNKDKKPEMVPTTDRGNEMKKNVSY